MFFIRAYVRILFYQPNILCHATEILNAEIMNFIRRGFIENLRVILKQNKSIEMTQMWFNDK